MVSYQSLQTIGARGSTKEIESRGEEELKGRSFSGSGGEGAFLRRYHIKKGIKGRVRNISPERTSGGTKGGKLKGEGGFQNRGAAERVVQTATSERRGGTGEKGNETTNPQ